MSLLAAAAVGVGLSCTGALGQGGIPAQRVPPTFADPVGIVVGERPWGIAAADIAGDGVGKAPDGFPDIAVANEDDGTVSIFLNQGVDGNGDWLGFGSPITVDLRLVSPNAAPVKVALDNVVPVGAVQLPDLVVTSPATQEVFVYRNNTNNPGEFIFHFALDLSTVPGAENFEPRGLVLANFEPNFNDRIDAAVASQSTAQVAILFNDGTGRLDDLVVVVDIPELGSINDPCAVPYELVAGEFWSGDSEANLPDVVTSNRTVPDGPKPPAGSCLDGDSITLVKNLGNRVFEQETRDGECVSPDRDWDSPAITAERFTRGTPFDDPVLAVGEDSIVAVGAVFHNDDGTGVDDFEHDCADDQHSLSPVSNLALGADAGHLNSSVLPDLVFPLWWTDEVGVLLLAASFDGTFETAADGSAFRYNVRPAGWPMVGPVQVLIVDLTDNGLGDIVTVNEFSNSGFRGSISVLIQE